MRAIGGGEKLDSHRRSESTRARRRPGNVHA
jgi:hypothetical protein